MGKSKINIWNTFWWNSYYQPLVLHFKLLNWKSKNVIDGKENSEGKYYNTILFWLLVDISLAIHLHNCSIQANRSIITQNDKKVPAWKKAMDILKQQEKFSHWGNSSTYGLWISWGTNDVSMIKWVHQHFVTGHGIGPRNHRIDTENRTCL